MRAGHGPSVGLSVTPDAAGKTVTDGAYVLFTLLFFRSPTENPQNASKTTAPHGDRPTFEAGGVFCSVHTLIDTEVVGKVISAKNPSYPLVTNRHRKTESTPQLYGSLNRA
jgi:hypothetical protein